MTLWRSYINEYKAYLKLERGLSENTIMNYVYDIEKLQVLMEKARVSISRENMDRLTIQEFIYEISGTVNAR